MKLLLSSIGLVTLTVFAQSSIDNESNLRVLKSAKGSKTLKKAKKAKASKSEKSPKGVTPPKGIGGGKKSEKSAKSEKSPKGLTPPKGIGGDGAPSTPPLELSPTYAPTEYSGDEPN